MESTPLLIPISAVLILILMSAFFSGSETGLTSISRARIHKLRMEGNRRATAVSKLLETKEQLISAILLGNNVVNIAASAIATALAIRLFGESGVIYATGVMTLLVLIFAEVLPKTYAVRHANQVALAVAPAFTLITRVLGPFTMAIQAIVNRVISVVTTAPKDDMTGVEVLRGAVDMYHAEGGVLTEDRDMLSGIFDLGDTQVEKIMIHRSDMTSINVDAPLDEVVAFVANSLHSRIPVWKEAPDKIIGILHTKDLFKALQNQAGDESLIEVNSLLRDPWFVPETITLKNQLKAFQTQKQHIAMVVDEFGSVTGLVTLEDIIEEVVGEIHDEHDAPEIKRISRDSKGAYEVDGDISLRDLNRELGWTLSDEDSTTVAGYLMTHAQRIPDEGEIFEIGDCMFEVLQREETQITQIKILKSTEDPTLKNEDPDAEPSA